MAEDEGIDMDYVLLSAAVAGTLAAAATIATLMARPMLLKLGRELPLPTVESFMGGD